MSWTHDADRAARLILAYAAHGTDHDEWIDEFESFNVGDSMPSRVGKFLGLKIRDLSPTHTTR